VKQAERKKQAARTLCLLLSSCWLFQCLNFCICSLHHVGYLLSVIFYPDDGGSMFFQNVGKLILDDTASRSRRKHYSSETLFCWRVNSLFDWTSWTTSHNLQELHWNYSGGFTFFHLLYYSLCLPTLLGIVIRLLARNYKRNISN
jgi:hypothetical protein